MPTDDFHGFTRQRDFRARPVGQVPLAGQDSRWIAPMPAAELAANRRRSRAN